MLNCDKATRLSSDAMERNLAVRDKISLYIHLAMCSGCRNAKLNMRLLRNISRAYIRKEDT